MKEIRISPRRTLHAWACAGRTLTLALFAAAIILSPLPFAGRSPADAAPATREVVIGTNQEPDTLNPWMTIANTSWEVANLFLDSLTRIDERGRYVPVLAKEVPSRTNGGISPDYQTFTYKLRDNLTWHDGRPITAEDVVFTYQAVIDPKIRIASRAGFDAIASVEAPDAKTVVFKLKTPSAAFLELFNYQGILPKHALQGDMNTHAWNAAPRVGSGPFIFQQWTRNNAITLVKNPKYYRPTGNIDRIVVRFIPQSQNLLNAMETGELDMRFLVGVDQIRAVRRLQNWKLLSTPGFRYFHIAINNADPILAEPRVRRALAAAIDKKAIADALFEGTAQPHWSPLPRPSWAWVDVRSKDNFDAGRARQLLEEAGWTPGPGGVRQREGRPLTIVMMNLAGNPDRLQVVQAIQQMWQAVGARLEVREVDLPTYVSSLNNRTYQSAYGFWTSQPDPDSVSPFYSSRGLRWLNLDWEIYDQILDRARREPSRDKRRFLYHQFQELVAERVPNIILFNVTFQDAIKSNIGSFKPNASKATNMWNAWEWTKGN